MIGLLITVAFVALLIAMFTAPLETLGWWAGWYGDDGETMPNADSTAPYRVFGPRGAEHEPHFIVFLDGIAKVGDVNYDDVQSTLDELALRLPNATVLGDIMPYSVLNQGLLKNRPLARFWRLAYRLKTEGRAPLINFMINIRNLMQVLVAADGRYGPLYGQGEARAILNSLRRHGYEPDDSTPVTLIGYSGGAQIALTAAPFLRSVVRGPINLLSLAGVMANTPGLATIDHLYDLQSSSDWVPEIARVIIPGRWRVFPGSYWNRLVSSGRYTHISLPAFSHSGKGSYLDATVIDEVVPRKVTVNVIVELLELIQSQAQLTADIRPRQNVPLRAAD